MKKWLCLCSFVLLKPGQLLLDLLVSMWDHELLMSRARTLNLPFLLFWYILLIYNCSAQFLRRVKGFWGLLTNFYFLNFLFQQILLITAEAKQSLRLPAEEEEKEKKQEKSGCKTQIE